MMCLQDQSQQSWGSVHCVRFTTSVQKSVLLKINLFHYKKKDSEPSQGVLLKGAKDA